MHGLDFKVIFEPGNPIKKIVLLLVFYSHHALHLHFGRLSDLFIPKWKVKGQEKEITFIQPHKIPDSYLEM